MAGGVGCARPQVCRPIRWARPGSVRAISGRDRAKPDSDRVRLGRHRPLAGGPAAAATAAVVVAAAAEAKAARRTSARAGPGAGEGSLVPIERSGGL